MKVVETSELTDEFETDRDDSETEEESSCERIADCRCEKRNEKRCNQL
jgi:hypothetical protein